MLILLLTDYVFKFDDYLLFLSEKFNNVPMEFKLYLLILNFLKPFDNFLLFLLFLMELSNISDLASSLYFFDKKLKLNWNFFAFPPN